MNVRTNRAKLYEAIATVSNNRIRPTRVSRFWQIRDWLLDILSLDHGAKDSMELHLGLPSNRRLMV